MSGQPSIQFISQIERHLLDDEVMAALKIAEKAHFGQFREFGAEPYLLHPIRVALLASRQEGATSTHVAAALLHDVIEDSHFTIFDLSEQGISEATIAIVIKLTKGSSEVYAEVIKRISADGDARMVKWCDVLDNLVTLPPGEPRVKKYTKALAVLGMAVDA